MSCGPGADAFIEKHFKDCVYNVRDYIGFCLGLAAIAFWIVAQLPQYYRNYKTKSAEALSPWFLAQWLLGDTFNLIGALLQGQQLPTTVYTAMYFVIADVFMMMQYIYYGALQRRREQVLKLQARRRHHHHHQHHRRQHQTHDGSSSREREALLGQPHTSSAAPERDWGGQQQQQQQQPSSWPAQQGPDGQLAASRPQQHSQGSQQPGTPQQHHQQQQHCGLPDEPPEGYQEHESGSCSDCSASSSHSSSKGVKPPSRHSRPPKGYYGDPAVDGWPSASCSATAAEGAVPGGLRGAPGFGWPVMGVHWGGVRSVVAVGVLVAMGLVSLLPASSTRGIVMPARFAARPAAATAGQQMQGAASARAIRAGPQQGLHISAAGVLSSPAVTSLGSSLSTSSSSSSSSGMALSGSTDSSSSQPVSSRGWARQRRVGVDAPDQGWSFVVGTGLGYVASVLYLCSRVSQIHKNYCRKSSEGLALVMFMMAVCANLCTGTSIILRTFTLAELKEQLPWIIGSLGTISLDMIILWQSTVYSKAGAQQGAGGAAAVHSTRQHHQHHHHHSERQHLLGHQAVDVGSAAAAAEAEAGSSHSTEASWGQGAAAALDGMPLAPHRGSQLLGRRHLPAGGIDAMHASQL